MLGNIVGGLLQTKPKVPAFVGVDVQAEQKRAIEGNTAALPGLQAQAGKVNTFNQSEIQRMLELAMPGYAKLRDKGTATVNDLLSGKIPDDVRNAIGRNAAGRSLYGGFGGSGMGRNLEARDLGLTSLDLMSKGLSSAERWIGQARTLSPTFDVTSMFVRPEFQVAHAVNERNARFQRDWVDEQLDAQYSAGTIIGQALVKNEDMVWGMMSGVLQSAAGGAAGGMMCWVAREVFTPQNPEWLLFREWMLTKAPLWFVSWYLKNGERFAAFISDKPVIKNVLRTWMRSRIKTLEV
jgi:hypothetical protein